MTIEELVRALWNEIPRDRKIHLQLIDYDPAGSTYDEVERVRSKQLRNAAKALGIDLQDPLTP